jgi:hypothetical protein
VRTEAAGALAKPDVWSKRGLLIPAPVEQSWAHSHAALPAVERIDGNKIDVLYSPRDARGRAHIARVHMEAISEGELVVVGHDPEPVLAPGPAGAFDESGVTMSCVVEGEHASFLYYSGWTLGVTVPFYFYGGLAIRPHGQRDFERISAAPILERSAVDPYLTASPWVLREGALWRMWYVSCTGWEIVDGEPRHYYHLRYAESSDGIEWRRDGKVAIDFADEHEYAISRPCVVRDGSHYRMWFAARGDRYRLGFAESCDGVNWSRDDSRVSLEPAQQGWDAEMVAYPAILELGRMRYMLYNGNGYGKSGIGYAVSEAAG